MVGSWTLEYHKEDIDITRIFSDVSGAKVTTGTRFMEALQTRMTQNNKYSTVAAGITTIRADGAEKANKNCFVVVAKTGKKRFELLFEIEEKENCRLIGANVPEMDPIALKSLVEGIAEGEIFSKVQLLI